MFMKRQFLLGIAFFLRQMKILITAGPTREYLDPVRYLTNGSTGRMGYALAEAAVGFGWQVTLVSGPVNLLPPPGVALIRTVSAAEMAEAVFSHAAEADLLIMAAAVADYRPAEIALSKIKKTPGTMMLPLERTVDILAELGKLRRHGQILVGFAAETDDLEANAREKLARKDLDWIAANTVADGFGSLTDKVILLGRKGERFALAKADKKIVARELLRIVADNSSWEK